MKKLNFKIIVFFALSTFSFQLSAVSYAQDDLKKIKQLETQVLSNLKDKKALASLEMLAEMYFAQHQYNSFIEFLRRLDKKKHLTCEIPVGYYIALCRYHQLKYLEQMQAWKEYFEVGSAYKQELFVETEKIVEACPLSPFGLRAQSLNWLQHKAQNDSQTGDSLHKLVAMANTYAPSAVEIEAIKEVADMLNHEAEAGLAKSVYQAYVGRLLTIEKSPFTLQSSAEKALKEGNVDLAEIIYDRYIETIQGSLAKDNLAAELIAIIRNFATDGWDKGNDLQYAEKVFGILEESCGKEYFTEALQYLRAYNLERLKEYSRSAEEFENLVMRFPESAFVDEAEFKLGIMYVYLLLQREKGIACWQKVIERNTSLEYSAESLYHKSLLNQYAQDFEVAKKGYAEILELISGKADFKNLSERTGVRQKEIQESKPIEYNLKAFLDTVLKAPQSNQAGVELLVRPFKAISLKQEEVTFNAQQFLIETGCLAPELAYLWSGDLGSIQPVPTTAEFTTDYQSPGTKVVNLVVLSPSGVMGGALEMVDVYSQKEGPKQ